MSELFKLEGWKDVVRGLIMSAVVAALAALQQLLTTGGHFDWKIVVTAGISGGLTFIIHKFGSDSEGKLGGKI